MKRHRHSIALHCSN